MDWWKQYQVDVSSGVSGDWKIDRFVVSEADEEREMLRSLWSSSSRGQIPVSAGRYTGLWNDGILVMSDTQGDYWRWIFTNNLSGYGGNPMVCEACDGINEEVIARWKQLVDRWEADGDGKDRCKYG
jgi:hypothetical protein